MKKIIVSLLLLVPIVTGCTNIDTQLTINDDKSASVVTSLTYFGDLKDKNDNIALTISDNYEKFLDSLYKTEKVNSAKLSTITATKKVKNLKYSDIDLSSLGFKTNHPDGKFVELKKNFFITSFNIDCTYDLKEQIAKINEVKSISQNKTSKSLEPEYYQKYGDPSELETDEYREDFLQNLDEDTKEFVQKHAIQNNQESKPADINDLKLSFSIKVPSFASYNNADSIDGNAYIWNIKKDSPTNIKLQYVQYSGFAIGFLLIAGVALLVLLARKILKHDSQKRIDN